MAATFGLDFGTTNSLITHVGPDPETKELGARVLLEADGRPHPSVVWYQNTGTVAGRRAKNQLNELGLGVFGDIIRSPKTFLGSPSGIYVGGVTRQSVDVVSDLLKFLREDALRRVRGNRFESAVVTIPVDMRGPARAELREAAKRAGFEIQQFVHEPLAALYGYLRAKGSFRRELANLDRRLVLVVDWGGGTLDLTLCHLRADVLSQVANVGDNEVGGDNFDNRLRQLVRQKHEAQFPNVDWSRIQPSGESRLIQACEDAKIALSTRYTTALFVRDLLAVAGPEKDIRIEISRAELDGAVQDLVARGLRKIDTVLDLAGVPRGSVELCLATGGMVAMPVIQDGLRELFGLNRLHSVANSATVISEGAAWIAHDGVSLQLSKPVELLHANNSYLQLISTDTTLPMVGQAVQRQIDMYCVDPSDGFAKFLFARPRWPGRDSLGDERVPYALVVLPVDSFSRPLLERLQVQVTIDQDLIAEVQATSQMRAQKQTARIHDLEFGLNVMRAAGVGDFVSKSPEHVRRG